MKSLFLSGLILILLNSCQTGQKKQLAEQRKKDSLLQVQMAEREAFLADSLTKAKRLEQAMTAFGSIRFGMTRDTVQAVMKRTLSSGNSRELGAYKYYFVPAYNDAGQLYQLELQSASESSLQLESTVKSAVENLAKIIRTKYGDPQKSQKFPDDFELVEPAIKWTEEWQFDTKNIKVGVATVTEGSRYKAVCRISDDPLRIKQLTKGSELLKSKIKSAAADF